MKTHSENGKKLFNVFEPESNCESKIEKTVIYNGTKIRTKPKLLIVSVTESKLFFWMGTNCKKQVFK